MKTPTPSDEILIDQRSSGGFGGYHLAVLAVAARFFDAQTWADITVPANEVSSSQYNVPNVGGVLTSSRG